MKNIFYLLLLNLFNVLFVSAQNTVLTRFVVPKNYVHEQIDKDSFGAFLQNLSLKDKNSQVKYYDGQTKNNLVYDAVIDLKIGNKNLHQCADAVIRLRADYFYAQKKYDKIHFNFTNGFRVDFSKWILGNRIVVNGNNTSWSKTAKPSSDVNTYWQYLETIFQYAGTSSLEKEMKSKSMNDLQIGDVFIKGGFPGHAVIVIDKAVNLKSGKTIFLLAQSYMPAQELQVLKNTENAILSPWYELDSSKDLVTPEWTFTPKQFKSF